MKEKYNCIQCGKEHEVSNVTSSRRKYCSLRCQQDYQFQERIDKWIETGVAPGIKVIRRYLINKDNHCCTCGRNTWNGKPLVLEVEHKDGNSENNSFENLALICPNCHSQTDTYKAKNKGNGRYARRQRYVEGKSW